MGAPGRDRMDSAPARLAGFFRARGFGAGFGFCPERDGEAALFFRLRLLFFLESSSCSVVTLSPQAHIVGSLPERK